MEVHIFVHFFFYERGINGGRADDAPPATGNG